MSATLDAVSWLQVIGLGGAMGALGQGIRAIVGIKKLNDAANGTPASTSDLIEPSRIWISFGIGFIAGALAAVSLITDLAHVSSQQIFMLMAAGYSGADFVEGFMSRQEVAVTIATTPEAGGPDAGGTPPPPATATPPAVDGSVG
ncbi:MAG: hypothetical protein WC729_10545 [Sphingomonas sp.]|jgi:hypothetical protein|uniref:hypothetical protein n=1 Tax=Sphingomonas sp. TaxID=28214 RepID=UPI003564EDEA